MNELQQELDRTKIALMQSKESVFFTTIVFSLKFVWDDTQPTAYTDGYTLGFNPAFFLGMPKEQRVGVLVHEACHVAYDHMGRRMGRDMNLWNMAADHVINLELLGRGFKLPEFRLADERFKGMSTEQVYNLLQAEQYNEPNPMADMRDPEQVKPEEYKRHIEDLIIRASVQAKMGGGAGSIPGEVELFIDTLLKPRLPWQTILRREVGALVKKDYSWMRPARRFFPEHHLPSLSNPAPYALTFYVDISGSVSDHQFKVFVSEIAGAIRMFSPPSVTVVQFDTSIKSIDAVRSLAELSKIEFHGRGGTCPECIFEHMETSKPQLALVFTDGEFEWPRDTLKQRLLWLINDNPGFVPQFGRALHFRT